MENSDIPKDLFNILLNLTAFWQTFTSFHSIQPFAEYYMQALPKMGNKTQQHQESPRILECLSCAQRLQCLLQPSHLDLVFAVIRMRSHFPAFIYT